MSSAERWVLQFCHGYDGPFMDCARQYAVLFKNTPYKVCTVYLTGKPSSEVELGSASDEVIFLNYSSKKIRGLKISAIADFRKILRTHNFEFCIAHRFKPVYIALLGGKIPVIGIHHGFGDYHRRTRKLFANLFSKRLTLIGVSNSVRDEIRACLPSWPLEKIQTLYNRIDVKAVQAQQVSRNEARDYLGLPRDAWIVGNVGRLHPDKDQDTLIRGFAKAFPNLRDKSLLVIIGSGPLETKLKKLACDLKIDEAVMFLGQIPDARRYFRALDCFALTSDSEPFGMVLLEAMVAEVPVICSACGGASEVVDKVGVFFEFSNTDALSCAIQLMAEYPDESRQLLTESALKKVEYEFSDQAVNKVFWHRLGTQK